MVGHTMSLIHKIPPMVSALAFGYGVGMSAPESAITSVHAAVVAYGQGERAAAPMVVTVPAQAPAPRGPVEIASRGGESRELGRLRELSMRSERAAAACELDRPTYTRPPQYRSTADAWGDDVEELDTVGAEALSRLQLPDVPLSITRRTLKYVRFFARTDRGRGMFETWLARSGKYQDLIQAELRERRLPEDLMWVSMIESGFDPRAKSPAGAVGLWQFMPATGEVYGLQQNRHLDQRRNPRLATEAAAHHLRDLYMRFGDWNLALAAYNMGYEQLLDRIDAYGTSDFNELARQGALPQETAAYVPKIAAAAIVANNLERFGFDKVQVSRPIDAAEIAVPPGTPLKTLAKAAGVSTATLRSLNPDVLGDRVPPGRGDFLVMIPPDTLARAQASLPALLDTEPVADDASVLNPVDLLGGRDFTRRKVRSEDDSLLSLLPHPKKRRAMRDPVADLVAEGAGIDPADDDDPAPAARRRPRRQRETLLYRVGQGDTLIGVARQFAVDVEDVARDNGLDAGALLRAGALLKLRVRPDMLDGAPDAEAAPVDRAAASEHAARGAAGGDEQKKASPRAERGGEGAARDGGGKQGREAPARARSEERGERPAAREPRRKDRG